MAWAPDYLTSAELKTFLRIDDTVDDAWIASCVTAASRAIDRAMGRQFGLVASAEKRWFTARWDRRRARWMVLAEDLMTVTGLVVTTEDSDGATVGTITAYDLEPRNAAVKSRPWEMLVIRPTSTVTPTGAEHEMGITARWGWTTVPEPVKTACRIQASRFFARRDSPYGVAGSPDLGNELRLLARLDVDVDVSLGPFRRRWVAA